MSKEKDLVVKIPYLLGFMGAEAQRLSRMNELVFEDEIANKESVFARNDEDSFTARIEQLFMKGMLTPENAKTYMHILNLLSIKNNATKPCEMFEVENQQAIKMVEESDIDVGYTLEEALSTYPWAT